MASEGDITLIPVGPLTNIAVAMRAEPRIKGKIKRIVIMGGGHGISNRTSAAEFNIWKDPEAAQIVLTSGCDVIALDCDRQRFVKLLTDTIALSVKSESGMRRGIRQ